MATMSFSDVLIERLQARDNTVHKFHTIISKNNQLLRSIVELEKAVELAKITQHIPEGSPSQQVADLDRRIKELNEERAEMYKTQSANAQRLVNLNEQLRIKEEKDSKQTEE
ncbi:hypothetical protein BDF20DRAFT_299928 [Mycotypha africana]|uniref:uncharacterized protein n=1 Tax=Mycotypha africana TaxID=64632 RepID=UPI002300506C|nr:uncharacterized protein BDF20DRAFT_299928 [Mycotypha africana]KAI8987984.1 hypothetical protein BDF20DRAFT_299928 [Mycotypha africana]